MATYDDIARMRAALMGEKRARMARHPQQVAGAVGQAQSALAALAEQLQRQGIASDRITAANARAEADRKQRAAVEAAKAKAAAEKARLDREAADARAANELGWKRERFGEEQRTDPDFQRMRGFEVSERIAPPPPGDDDMPDGDDDLATPDERLRAASPEDRYNLARYRQAEEDRERRARLDEATIGAKNRSGVKRPKTAQQLQDEAERRELRRLEIADKKRILTEGKELPESKVNTAKAATTIRLMRAARALKQGVNTGPMVQQAVEYARKYVPFAEFKGRRPFETVNAALGRTLAKYIEEGRLTDPDALFYAEKLISGELNDNEYMIALDVVEPYLVGATEDKLDIYEGQQYNVGPHREQLEKARNAPLETLPGMSSGSRPGKIRVRRKVDGKTGTIDAGDFNPDKYEKL